MSGRQLHPGEPPAGTQPAVKGLGGGLQLRVTHREATVVEQVVPFVFVVIYVILAIRVLAQ